MSNLSDKLFSTSVDFPGDLIPTVELPDGVIPTVDLNQIAYKLGTGISDITDPAIGLGMQGMSDSSQKTTGVESRLYSRAFIICNINSGTRVVIVVADIWSGTQVVKSEVLRRLRVSKDLYSEANILISGTHTHSAPGGFSGHKLYEHVCGGFDPHTFECVVSGITRSIQKAHDNLSPGRLYLNKGKVSGCGMQRSVEAYLNNPSTERHGQDDVDKEMLLLKFTRVSQDKETPIGMLNWQAIHPTDRGQENTLVNGDNKGYASLLFERAMGTNYSKKDTFVAAFANSNCGDVSGNVEFGSHPKGNDRRRMELHGKRLFDKAKELFDLATGEINGNIRYAHTRVDMSNVVINDAPGKRTWPGALGLSFAAGSTEDSTPNPNIGLKEGLVEGDISVTERTAQGLVILVLAGMFGITHDDPQFVRGHLPKPIVLRPGLMNPPITPNILPLQILTIGTLAVVAIPGEITTMAGRRLKTTVSNALAGIENRYVALAAYANDYSQYITTKEEYDMQHYEGASTLFGPYTLMAYQQEFKKLANALKNGGSVASGPHPSNRSAPTSNRVTIRNRSSITHTLKCFNQSDPFAGGPFGVPFLTLTISGHSERMFILNSNLDRIKIWLNNAQMIEHIKSHNLVIIEGNGYARVTKYKPPH